MKAVVMAGGEGTRLRPLTSNQPKPMVPIVGKPCMEHIIELLRSTASRTSIVTLAFLPQAIRSYFGDGETLGVNIEYSVEERRSAPPARCGSPSDGSTRRSSSSPATRSATSTSARSSSSTARRAPPSRSASSRSTTRSSSGSSSPTRTGAVERFLEKPSWGQVFSDTINTGIYVLEPEVLRHIPTDRPYDFSKELFPLLLEMGRPIYGYVLRRLLAGHRQPRPVPAGELRRARRERAAEHPGIRLRGNVWMGEGVEIDDLEAIEGPAFIGNYCRIARDATVGPYSVLATSVTLRERARDVRSVIDASTHIGRSALIEGAILGRSCDIRDARAHPRGRRDRRRGRRSAPRASSCRRPDLPVQGGRDRLAASTRA